MAARTQPAVPSGRSVEAVDEGVHLLLDDVGHFADGALEERRRLDDGQADRPVAVALQPRTDGLLEQFPEFGLVGQDVVHPAHGLQRLTHACSFFV
jgi:hypothetical protein